MVRRRTAGASVVTPGNKHGNSDGNRPGRPDRRRRRSVSRRTATGKSTVASRSHAEFRIGSVASATAGVGSARPGRGGDSRQRGRVRTTADRVRGGAGRAARAGARRSRRRSSRCGGGSRTRPSGCAPSRSACSRPRASWPRPSPRTRSSPTPCARRASTSPRCAKRSRSSPSRRRPTARCSARNDDGTVDVFSGGRKMRVAVHPDLDDDELRPRAPRSCSTSRSTSCWPAAPRSTGEVVTFKEVLDDGDRALIVGRADEERVAELADDAQGPQAPRRRHRAAWTPARACCSRSCPGPRSRSSCSRRCPTSPTTTSAASTARSSRSPTRSSCRSCTSELFAELQAAGAEGHPALRPARLRQDAHRQGGGQLAGQEGGRGQRRQAGPQLLPQHQGPRAAQQVRRRDRAPDPPRVPAGPGEERGGLAGHRLLRRDGLAVPHPRHRHQLRHGVHDRAAAAGRDRRRRDAEERHRDRRLQPRGPHRPGHPAPGPPRREDQDRAPQRGGRGPDLRPLPHRRPAPRRRRGRRRSAAATATRPCRR